MYIYGKSHNNKMQRLAILWHKDLAGMCKIVDYEDDRFLGIDVLNGDKSVLYINV